MSGETYNHLAVGVCSVYNVRVHLEWDTRTEAVQLTVLDAAPQIERRVFRGRCGQLPLSTPDNTWLNSMVLGVLWEIELDGPVTMLLGDRAAVAKFLAKWGDYEWLTEKLSKF
ncbi:hypothetical protein ABCR94_38915 [Streptomyces sp. 21So2-11]|uniref:hypothetical protein n=1 Tax=Streptomyces sp. 21So2-11 TaxID=3144408 RepID=UPI00321B43D5